MLLDTHSIIWFYQDDPQLSQIATDTISNPQNQKLVSPASYWEIAIKLSTGKLKLTESYEDFIEGAIVGNGFDVLAIDYQHTSQLVTLPYFHRDPFDRLLIAQAMAE